MEDERQLLNQLRRDVRRRATVSGPLLPKDGDEPVYGSAQPVILMRSDMVRRMALASQREQGMGYSEFRFADNEGKPHSFRGAAVFETHQASYPWTICLEA